MFTTQMLLLIPHVMLFLAGHGTRTATVAVTITAKGSFGDDAATKQVEDIDLGPPTKKRVEFMKSRQAVDIEGAVAGRLRFEELKSKGNKMEASADETLTPKVAFIFMLYDGLDQEKVWESFFSEDAAGLFSIYTHRAQPKETTAAPLGDKGAIAVPHVSQGWCALSGLQVAVLAEALADPANVQFVLASQNAVPLKPFQYVYTMLKHSAKTSKICYASAPSQKQAKKEALVNELTSKGNTCHFRDFYSLQNKQVRKHHQWVVLSRQHAYNYVQYSIDAINTYQETWQITALDLGNRFEGCSDEATVSIALMLGGPWGGKLPANDTGLAAVGIEESCLTWLRWRKCFSGTNLDLTDSLLRDVQKVIDSGAFWDLGKQANATGRTEFIKKASTALNGFPHFFGPPAEPDTVPLSYLEMLVLEEGFMFGRKFNSGVKVDWGVPADNGGTYIGNEFVPQAQRGNYSMLHTVLPMLWSQVDTNKVYDRVWSRLDSDGMPQQRQ